MLSPQEIAFLPDTITKIFEEWEDDIIIDIADRISKNSEMTATGSYRAKILEEMGLQRKYIVRRVAAVLHKSEVEIEKLYNRSVYKAMKDDEEIFKEAFEAGLVKQYKPNKKTLDPILRKGLSVLEREIRGVTNSYAQKYSSAFESALDWAYAQSATGLMSMSEACQKANKMLADNGIQYYMESSSGRKEQVTVVVARAVRTTISKTILDCQFANCVDLGCDLVEVSSHMDARPEHAEWQGQIYSISGKHKKYRKFQTATGYGSITGLGGINCRHSFYPYFEGLSTKSSKEFSKTETEEAYQRRQAYMSASNKARKYRIRSKVEKTSGLDNTEAKVLASQWQKTAEKLYKSIPVVKTGGGIELTNNYSVNWSRMKVKKLLNEKEVTKLDDFVTSEFTKLFKGYKPAPLTLGKESKSSFSISKSGKVIRNVSILHESDKDHVKLDNQLLAVAIHERTHDLFNCLVMKRVGITNEQNVNLIQCELYKKIHRELREKVYTVCFTDETLDEIRNTIVSEVSERSRYFPEEFIAESFVQVIGGKNVSPLAKKVYNWIVKEWRM